MPQDEKTKADKKLLRLVDRTGMSFDEIRTVLKSSKGAQNKKSWRHYHATGKTRIGVFSDAHIGQEKFHEGLFERMGKTFKKKKVDAVYQVGDILEGMSGRPGHVYELAQVGFEAQMDKAVQLFTEHLNGLDIYGIDGNHDGWYRNKGDAGVIVGRELENRVKNYTHLGEMEADVWLAKNVKMSLMHPNDGTAYAISYKLQKLMEAYTGGEKPNILLEGHYHKALYFFNRNIHGLEAGTVCGQTKWMRGRKIPAHMGFWVVDIKHNKNGVQEFSPTFHPEYNE